MHINIILEKDNKIISIISNKNNHLYLSKDDNDTNFPYLSEVELDDYSCFGPKHMDALIKELNDLKKEVCNKDDLAHIDDIINLANMCQKIPGSCLTFSGVPITIDGKLYTPTLS